MLRSFAYAATVASVRPRHRTCRDGWEEQAREQFLAGYFETVDPTLLPVGPDRDRAAARGLRAREGRLRAALRARQSARVGRHSRRGHLAADRPGGSDVDDRARCESARHARRARDEGRCRRTCIPARSAGSACPAGRRRRRGDAEGSGGPLGGAAAEGEAAAASTSSRSTIRTGARTRCAIRMRSCRRSATSTSISRWRAGTRSSTRSSVRTCARSTAQSARPFAVWAPNARSVAVVGDFNFVGRAAASDALARIVGHLGAVRPRRPRRREVQVRDPHAGRTAADQGRSARVPHGGSARHGLRGVALAARVERRRSGSPSDRRRILFAPDLDLRGAPRLVAPEPARGQPSAHVPRARRRARRLRRGSRFHACRAHAGDGASVLRARGATRSPVTTRRRRASAHRTTSAPSSIGCMRAASA